MSWFTKYLQSSIGQKILMAATGLFLMLFLVVHLLGNFQLLKNDGGEAFNAYTYFMTHNPLIKTVSYLLYLTIVLHAWKGIALWLQNRAARGAGRYAVAYVRGDERISRNMAWLGIVILLFILVHMYQFWLQMKLGDLPEVQVAAYDFPVKNLFVIVEEAFANLGYVVFYVLCMVAIAFHLWHGFWSSLQTLGISHRKYNHLINIIGIVYAIAIPAGFALIPLWMYFID